MPPQPDEGGLSGAMLPSGAVASPRPDVLRRELDAFRSIAESTPRPEFEVMNLAADGSALPCTLSSCVVSAADAKHERYDRLQSRLA